jgi:hypothetical protein
MLKRKVEQTTREYSPEFIEAIEKLAAHIDPTNARLGPRVMELKQLYSQKLQPPKG